MRQRFTVRREINNPTFNQRWIILDEELVGKAFAVYKSRREARAACQQLNAAEALVRADQQQSREETI